jgi:chemotaxis response regulator CheB
MTGMGDDGAAGLGAIKSAGGMTIAQSEESCVVSGMPRAAIMRGYANRIVPLDSLAAYLTSQYGTERTTFDKKEKDKNEKPETIPVPTQRS